MSNYSAALYRIAEEMHKGADDPYVMELCNDVAREFNYNSSVVLADVVATFAEHFGQ